MKNWLRSFCGIYILAGLTLALTGCQTQSLVVSTPRLKQLSDAVQKNPTNANNVAELGFAWVMVGEDQRARACFARAIQLSPEDWHTFETIGWAYVNLNVPKEALTAFQKAAKFDKTPIDEARDHHHVLAIGYWINGDKVAALKEYDLVATKYPDDFAAWDKVIKHCESYTWTEKKIMYQIFDAWDRGYRLDK